MAKINSINNKAQDLTIDPGASGDSFLQFNINDVAEFKIGVDDSDSDKFKISQGSDLAANTTFVMTANGERTMPLQPAFLAVAGTENNATGDSTFHDIGSITATTEIYDQGSNFTPGDGAGTGALFTAPISGRYLLSFSVTTRIDSSTGGDDQYTRITTSNRTYFAYTLPTRNQASGFYGIDGDISWVATVLADMDASDTCIFYVVSRGGSKVDDIIRGYLSGVLMV